MKNRRAWAICMTLPFLDSQPIASPQVIACHPPASPLSTFPALPSPSSLRPSVTSSLAALGPSAPMSLSPFLFLFILLTCTQSLRAAASHDSPPTPFIIEVLDDQTNRGVPLVELRTV